MKRMAKKITLEDLAAMTKHGFDEAREITDEIRVDIHKIHKQLVHWEEAFRGTQKHISSHNHRLTLAEARIDHLEAVA